MLRGWAMAVLAVAAGSLLAGAESSWPKCSVRSGERGGPAIVVDGEAFAPVLFAGNNQFNRDEVLLDEMRQAAAAGLRLFSINIGLGWHGEAPVTETLAKFCAAVPDGYFYVRVWLGPNDAWREAHPGDCVTGADGSRMPYASPSSEVWRAEAAQRLEACLREILGGPFASRFLGVCPTNLQTGEWFYERTDDFMDYSPANLEAFRAWLRKTYRTNKRLREAWHDDNVSIDTAAFASPELRDSAAWGPFRDPAVHRPAMDMHRFQNALIADTIAYFAATVKRVTEGRSLVGVFYGYAMELNNNGPRALAHSGHLALGALLECADIDLVHAPYSYFERSLGQPAHFHLPVDSVALHGKLAVLEEDSFTHTSQEPSADLIVPGWRERTRSIEETLALTLRNSSLFLTHRCGFWYFDLLSDARWSDPGFWNAVPLVRRMAAQLRSEAPFAPEVAFVVSEDAVQYLRDTTYPHLLASLSQWRAELDRTGTPVGYYLQSDLPLLPKSVKVIILANAYAIDESEQAAIDRRLLEGATVIWTYAPGIAQSSGIDPARVAAVTGLPVESEPGSGPVRIVSALSDETVEVCAGGWGPRFVVAPTPGADVVARYEDTGDIAAAACPARAGVSLYTATPRLPAKLLREVFRRAGVHLYRAEPGMTGVAGPYLIVHTEARLIGETMDEIVADLRAEKPIALRWTSPCAAVSRLFPPRASGFDTAGGNAWQDLLPDGVTAIYRCETEPAQDATFQPSSP